MLSDSPLCIGSGGAKKKSICSRIVMGGLLLIGLDQRPNFRGDDREIVGRLFLRLTNDLVVMVGIERKAKLGTSGFQHRAYQGSQLRDRTLDRGREFDVSFSDFGTDPAVFGSRIVSLLLVEAELLLPRFKALRLDGGPRKIPLLQ